MTEEKTDEEEFSDVNCGEKVEIESFDKESGLYKVLNLNIVPHWFKVSEETLERIIGLKDMTIAHSIHNEIKMLNETIKHLEGQKKDYNLQLEELIMNAKDDVQFQLDVYMLVDNESVKYRLYKYLKDKVEYKEE